MVRVAESALAEHSVVSPVDAVVLARHAEPGSDLVGKGYLGKIPAAGLHHQADDRAGRRVQGAGGGLTTQDVPDLSHLSGGFGPVPGALIPVAAVVMWTRASRLVCVTFGSSTIVGIRARWSMPSTRAR